MKRAPIIPKLSMADQMRKDESAAYDGRHGYGLSDAVRWLDAHTETERAR